MGLLFMFKSVLLLFILRLIEVGVLVSFYGDEINDNVSIRNIVSYDLN